MRFLTVCASVLGIGFMVFASGSANAQATRTWVSGVGDDANPCSRTAPCKTFAGAISKTATGGEINCLDPGGFGGVTITKSIQIICLVEAGVLVSDTNAIVVNAPAGSEVLLQGLDIEGLSTGLNGITVIGATKVTVQNCSIRNFTQSGINIAGPVGARVLVQDSIILSNATGINLVGNGAGNVAVVLRTTIDNHTGSSINIAAGSTLFLGASKLFGSAVNVQNAGSFVSFGDNALQGTGTPTSTIALK
jgi:hypothetical protein